MTIIEIREAMKITKEVDLIKINLFHRGEPLARHAFYAQIRRDGGGVQDPQRR